MMEFNQDIPIEKENGTLEDKVIKQDVFTELDTQFVKDETASQTVMKRMFLTRGLLDKSDLDEDMIPPMVRLLFICDKFKLESGKKLIDFLLALRVSKNRLGRIEGFSTVKSENDAKANSNNPVISFLGGKLTTL